MRKISSLQIIKDLFNEIESKLTDEEILSFKLLSIQGARITLILPHRPTYKLLQADNLQKGYVALSLRTGRSTARR